MNILGLGGLLIVISSAINFLILQGELDLSDILMASKYGTFFLLFGGILILFGSFSITQLEKELKDEKTKTSNELETLRIRIKSIENKNHDFIGN